MREEGFSCILETTRKQQTGSPSSALFRVINGSERSELLQSILPPVFCQAGIILWRTVLVLFLANDSAKDPRRNEKGNF